MWFITDQQNSGNIRNASHTLRTLGNSTCTKRNSPTRHSQFASCAFEKQLLVQPSMLLNSKHQLLETSLITDRRLSAPFCAADEHDESSRLERCCDYLITGDFSGLYRGNLAILVVVAVSKWMKPGRFLFCFLACYCFCVFWYACHESILDAVVVVGCSSKMLHPRMALDGRALDLMCCCFHDLESTHRAGGRVQAPKNTEDRWLKRTMLWTCMYATQDRNESNMIRSNNHFH